MDTDTYRHYRRHGSSLFFPIALITVGVVWLMVNNGMIPMENVYRLMPYWPVLLILAGIGLVLRRVWWPLAGLMWAGAAVLVIAALVAPPAFLPQPRGVEMQHQTLITPLENAKSAAVRLNLSINPSEVHAATSGQDLITADVYTANGATLDASGSEMKNVTLHANDFNGNFALWDFAALQGSRKWDIGLSPKVPLQLTVDAATGSTKLDLTDLKLDNLEVHVATGSLDLNLPQSSDNLPVNLNGGTGSMDVIIPSNTPVTLNANNGTGSLRIDVPQGAGVQVDVRNGGVGSIHLPNDFKKVSGESNKKEGVWQNNAFDGAKAPIKITLDNGTGSVTVR